MANIQERRDKNGTLISYSIRVHKGRGADGRQLKPYTTTFPVSPSWTEKTAKKKAEQFAAVFEKEIKDGVISDCKQTFQQYGDYCIELKESRGCKHSTISFYRTAAAKVYPGIGHIKMKELRPEHLNALYTEFQQEGVKHDGGKLSVKTILGYHRFISMVCEQAVKEGLILIAPSSRVDLPKNEKKEPAYFQPEQIAAIQEALNNEPIKWRVMLHLFMITGARRGEILGLKWKNVDFTKKQIYICNSVMYRPDIGVYEDTPKTESSKRYISIPDYTVSLLQEYRAWQLSEQRRLGLYYINKDFVFANDTGEPIHPDSVTSYCTNFSRKYNLPHIHPHAFRHTAASLLYFGGLDSVTIAHRLGHSQVSTTENIYAHAIEEAERRSADVLANIMLKQA